MQGIHTLRFEQMFFALQAAAEGLGIALIPLFLVLDDVVAGRLCAPFGLSGARQRQAYYVGSAPTSRKSRIVDEFCNWLEHEGHETESMIDGWAGPGPIWFR